MAAPPQSGPWASCCTTWCAETSRLNTTRRSWRHRFCSGGKSPQVSSRSRDAVSAMLVRTVYFDCSLTGHRFLLQNASSWSSGVYLWGPLTARPSRTSSSIRGCRTRRRRWCPPRCRRRSRPQRSGCTASPMSPPPSCPLLWLWARLGEGGRTCLQTHLVWTELHLTHRDYYKKRLA